MEWTISGYCRVLDSSRTVFLEKDGAEWFCDCNFPDCIYQGSCTLGKEMAAIKKGEEA